MWNYRAKLVRAVDGDTIDVEIDLGFYNFSRQRLRLLGIDTPERGQPGYSEAKQFVQDQLAGNQFTVRTEKAGKYGRFLAEVILPGGQDLVLMMLHRELGRPYDGGSRS